MKLSSQDLFYQVIELCEKGNFLNAFQLIITNPTVRYDSLSSTSPHFQLLINYVDSCAFKGLVDVKVTSQALRSALESDDKQRILLHEFIDRLQLEDAMLEQWLAAHESDRLADFFDRLLDFLDPVDHSFIKSKIRLLQQWETFKIGKPEAFKLIGGSDSLLKQPWRLFSYPLTLQSIEADPKKIPLIFMEPIQGVDYADFLRPFQNRPMTLVFETASHFFQMLQFPELTPFLISPAVYLYFLDLYPQDQLKSQSILFSSLDSEAFQPILMTKNEAFEEALPLFTRVFSLVVGQTDNEREKETMVANWLYKICQRLLCRIQSERYGKSRCLALSGEKGYAEWFDSHKGYLPPETNLGPLPVDYVKERLEEALRTRSPRSFCPDYKIRLAHIVPQIVDGGHAPTRLLKTLVFNASREWFEIIVISSERLQFHPLDYPVATYASESSAIRGRQTAEQFSRRDIQCFIQKNVKTYSESACDIARLLEEMKIDLAVFHGPDEINNLSGCLTDAPIRVLFDHGALPSYSCFDLLILSTEEAFKINRELFREMGMESCPLPFCIDSREGWEARLYSKEELGLPSSCFAMTTISNHLQTRLSVEMCRSIGEILQRCPQAVYAPIGPIDRTERLYNIFDQYGVSDRVVFLGAKNNPSHYARSMELYLNEFPFGSGLGLLDAMAAGCPVVSMYDEQGPQQARYAGTYFGLDHVIQSGKKEDYVELACRLIEDKRFYREWSDYAKTQYEKRVNVKQYVRQFELILEKFIAYKNETANS